MIESGSHEPGVSAADFGLPPDTAVRYERPAAPFTGLLTDYHVLDSVERGERIESWMLPSWAAIRIVLADKPIGVTLGSTVYDPVPVASIYGVTTRAMTICSDGGVTIGIGLSPIGWARLFSEPADAYRDRITPLDALLPEKQIAALVAELRASDCGPAVKSILDRFFTTALATPSPDEPVIERIMEFILDDTPRDIADAAETLGMPSHRLRRLSTRYFGFPPKTLMLRARFMRSFMRMYSAGTGADYSLVAGGYHDQSHFLRDADRFLGMTPRRFIALDMPYLDAVLRARVAVLGKSTGALDPARPAAR